MAETATVGAGELEGLIASALIASRTAEANARSVARALAQAEIDGQKGHGISRVPIYAYRGPARGNSGVVSEIPQSTLGPILERGNIFFVSRSALQIDSRSFDGIPESGLIGPRAALRQVGDKLQHRRPSRRGLFCASDNPSFEYG
jgi:hypothetical protein